MRWRWDLQTNCQYYPVLISSDRKNYFYRITRRTQISQLYLPICKRWCRDRDSSRKKIIGIHESIWKRMPENWCTMSGRLLVDYNRSGVPLIEIVSEPDMRSAASGKNFVRSSSISEHQTAKPRKARCVPM